MSFSNVAEQALLDLLFLNANWAGVGDATGLVQSAADGSFYVALHTATPGESGDQTVNEVAYTGYARVGVTRDAAGWTRTGSTVNNTAAVQFPLCTGGSATATHFSIGVASSGATQVVMYGALDNALAITNGRQPEFAAGALAASVD